MAQDPERKEAVRALRLVLELLAEDVAKARAKIPDELHWVHHHLIRADVHVRRALDIVEPHKQNAVLAETLQQLNDHVPPKRIRPTARWTSTKKGTK